MLLPPVLMPDAANIEILEAFKDLSLILPAPVNDTLSLGTFWLRTAPSTLRILTDALHELHASNKLPDHGEDVAATALQRVLDRQGNTRNVVWQKAEWYGADITTGSVIAGKTEKTLFARLGMGNAFERLGQVKALVELARRTEGEEEVRREMGREVDEFWDGELAAQGHING